MANNIIIPHSLDDYFQSTPIGSIDKAIGNNLYGINHRQVATAVPSNRDQYGLTFFVRPQLNMMADNIRNVRLFAPLLTDSNKTIQAFVRSSLDPRLQAGYIFKEQITPAYFTPLVDNRSAFLNVLTNNLNAISGWPDVVAPTFTSESGLYREQFSMVDGIVKNYESFDIDATFRNTKGDPIVYMFYIWLHYMANVFEGKLVPYFDMISENEIDYNTRIYRLVLDKDRNKVTKIAATGAAFPISVPTGSFFDFNNEHPFNDQNKDITIRFKCMGVEYQDDILVKEFNNTVSIFNSDMDDEVRDRTMIAIDKTLLSIFNNRGYPRINPKTYVLEWWVDKGFYETRTGAFLSDYLSPNLKPAPAIDTSNESFEGD